MDDSTNNLSEQLVLYLDGVLTGTARDAIEDLLASDTFAKTEYDNLLQIRDAIRHYGLKQHIAGVHENMMVKIKPLMQKTGRVKKIIRYSMAAAASLVLLIGGYVVYNSSALSSDKVFSSNYHAYELNVTRDGSNEFTPVERAYGEKNYTEVLRIHDAKEDRTAKAEFLTGVASLELNNNCKAIKCFKEVIEMNTGTATPVLHEESEYYLALAYINNKNYDFALTLLNKISDNEEHKYNKEVSPKLIRQVQQLKQK